MVDTTARQPHGTLAKHEAVEWARPVGPLRLPEVTAFASGAAQILAHHGGSLMLGGITELDPVDAAALAHHHDLLFLDGVQTLSPEAAAALARHRGGISLRGLRSLSPEVAAGIAGSAGGLWVDGITDLCPAAAAALAGHAGDLHLGALSKLSAETAAALATHHHQVTLPQLASLPADVARRLAAHDGRIILDGLEALSLEAALALAAHTGRLSLGGLTTLEPQVADALATHGGDLLLDGLASLSPTVAESLSHHRGWLSLAALKDLPPATAAALARHDGLVSLPPALRQEADAAGIPLPAHAGLARGRNGAEQKTRPLSSSKATPPKVIGVAIIGAGFGGLCMAIRLRDQGRSDFVIFDKEDSIGGTWRDNTYPGCGCDVPSHLYSYSFAPKTDWSRKYAGHAEILDYIQLVAERHGVVPHVQTRTTIVRMEWDEAGKLWQLLAADGRQFRARAVVSAVGGIHIPSVPRLTGLDTFAGPVLHTARWRHDVDLTGRRVAVIGTGASSIQLIPRIASDVASLTVFQRTPPWVLPRQDHPVSAVYQRAAAIVPGLNRLRRTLQFWRAESTVLGFTFHPSWMEKGEKRARLFRMSSVSHVALRRKLTPRYTLGCKRILLSDDYYSALTRDNVDVVVEPITEVRPWSIATADGAMRPVDVAILATGFRPFDLTEAVEVIGHKGVSLAETWKDGPQAYQGVAMAGFPNLFVIMGPNTALGHNSILFMIESQVRFISQCLGWIDSGRLPVVEVRADVQRTYNDTLQQRFEQTVWGSEPYRGDKEAFRMACASWYRHVSGRHHVLWPGSAVSYWLAMRRAKIRDFAA